MQEDAEVKHKPDAFRVVGGGLEPEHPDELPDPAALLQQLRVDLGQGNEVGEAKLGAANDTRLLRPGLEEEPLFRPVALEDDRKRRETKKREQRRRAREAGRERDVAEESQ